MDCQEYLVDLETSLTGVAAEDMLVAFYVFA
jgi:hypothetical protein